jgi:hypothetical protein
MSHDDSELDLADRLAITFEMQKKDDKNDTVHHEATRDQTMCPIKAAAKLVCQIRSYPNTNDETPISAKWIDNHTCHRETSSERIKRYLRAIGEDVVWNHVLIMIQPPCPTPVGKKQDASTTFDFLSIFTTDNC